MMSSIMDDLVDSLSKPKPKGGASLAAVVSAFVPTWFTGLVFVAAFFLIRQRYPKIYSPRSFIGTIPEKDRTPTPRTNSYFSFLHTLGHTDNKFLLHHSSLDAYLFLRFLRKIIVITFAGALLTWPILLPINAYGGGSSTQLDRLGIGNVKNRRFFYAHAIVACVFFIFVMFVVLRERIWLIGLRQAWVLQTSEKTRLSRRCVLFLSAPKEALMEENMPRFFGDGAVRIWGSSKIKGLHELIEKRNGLAEELEGKETDLILAANKEAKHRGQSYNALPEGVKDGIRPRHRVKWLPPSDKVDSVNYVRDNLEQVQKNITTKREERDGQTRGAGAVVVEFKTIADAQRAAQDVPSVDILALNPRYLGVGPKEIIWSNLHMAPERRLTEEGLATATIVAIIVFWTIISGFFGSLSNISYLAENIEWLSWLNRLPDAWLGLLSGLVPPLVTSYLNKFVPKLFRYVIKYFGGATTTSNEIKVQKWFMVFQIVQVFLVTAVFSGGATVLSQLLDSARDPSSIPPLLAKQLPKSSNYYLTYFIVQGTTTAADNLLVYSDLLEYLAYKRFFDKTPRQQYNRLTSMKGIQWGKVFPKFANFAIIALAYACIAPLVLGFAAAGLILYYLSYRYNLFYTIQPKVDTRGHAYALALQHLLAGVYIAELALIGLFGLHGAHGPSIMICVLFALTVLYNAVGNKYLGPLEAYVPVELATAEEGGEGEEQPLLGGQDEEQGQSRIQRLGEQARVPERVVTPVAKFFEPRFHASYRRMKDWIREGEDGDQEVLEYTDEQLEKAYVDPAIASNAPVVWLPGDEAGASAAEVRECEEVGIKASNGGAWVTDKNVVRWSENDWSKVPVWKQGVKY